MIKFQKSNKKLIGVALFAICLSVMVTSARAEVFYTPDSYNIVNGTVVEGNIYSVKSEDDGLRLGIRWYNNWYWFRMQYTINIFFEMENHKCDKVYMSFTQAPLFTVVDVRAHYTDSTWETIGNDVIMGDYSTQYADYEFDVNPSKYLDKISIYYRHTHSWFDQVHHYTYFDWIAAVPI